MPTFARTTKVLNMPTSIIVINRISLVCHSMPTLRGKKNTNLLLRNPPQFVTLYLLHKITIMQRFVLNRLHFAAFKLNEQEEVRPPPVNFNVAASIKVLQHCNNVRVTENITPTSYSSCEPSVLENNERP